jgi:redox-sensitive bicupin YhaK (pirin superfamily)
MSTPKTIQSITSAQPQRVGDGFVGKNAFHPQQAKPFSPFLLLDHHGPMQVTPSEKQRGVDEHPHRGFETVTVVYEGALEHRDSAGNYGKLFPGDVQWMTAAAGIVHEEKHEKEFSRTGGTLNFVQLWVNLPAAYKMIPPRYQELAAANFPAKNLADGALLRVIAGEFMGLKGTAHTFSPILLADLILQANAVTALEIPRGFNFFVYVLNGEVSINQKDIVKNGQLATFSPEGDQVEIVSRTEAKVLLLGGEPIHEPIATYGPFVMNTVSELQQAIADYQAGKMGHLTH